MVRAADGLGAGDGGKERAMRLGIVLILAGVVLGSPAAWADQDQFMQAPGEPTAAATPESRLNDGLALADKQDWRGGEADVELGKLDEARALLRRLRALDPSEAALLAAVIDGGGKASRRW